MFVLPTASNCSGFLAATNMKFHTSFVPLAASAAAKSDLATLRKKTGYSLSICKKALSENDNNLAEAEVWLRGQAQAQGWAKAQKLQGRNTSQGLMGLSIQENKAALVELNCETDFVARNQQFKGILERLASTCLSTSSSDSTEPVSKTNITRDEMCKLKTEDGSSLADLVALNIGQIGENMQIGDATFVQTAKDVSLAGLSHPATEEGEPILSGRYVALMAYTKADKEGVELPEATSIEKLPTHLCQHIIGMNPTFVKNKKDKENSFMHQAFLLDESITVEKLCQNAGLTVLSFTRREIGRSIE